jgi:hypothetical protein
VFENLPQTFTEKHGKSFLTPGESGESRSVFIADKTNAIKRNKT